MANWTLVRRFARLQVGPAVASMFTACLVAARCQSVDGRGPLVLDVCATALSFYLAYGTRKGAGRDSILDDLELLPVGRRAVLGSMALAAAGTAWLAALGPSILLGALSPSFRLDQLDVILHVMAAAALGIGVAGIEPWMRWRRLVSPGRSRPFFLSPIVGYGLRRGGRASLWMGLFLALLGSWLGEPGAQIGAVYFPATLILVCLSVDRAIESRRSGLYEDLVLTPLNPTRVSLAEIGALSVQAFLLLAPSLTVTFVTWRFAPPGGHPSMNPWEDAGFFLFFLGSVTMFAIACGHSMGKRVLHMGLACLLATAVWLVVSGLFLSQMLMFAIVTAKRLHASQVPWVLCGALPFVLGLVYYVAATVKPVRVVRPT